MEIKKIKEKDKKRKLMELLLLADEQQDMVEKYLDRGEMFVLDDGKVKAECVVVRESPGVYELKNIATLPEYQVQGYGRRLIEFLFEHYEDCNVMYVGTGESPKTLGFYRSCGFSESHRAKDFFLRHYDHPIVEQGVLLVDMIYLKRERKSLKVN